MKTAVVLSGGGAKGAYQIGVWKALKKMHIKYDIVTGTSAGALNGAFMTQKDYYKAIWMWENINFDMILDNQMNGDFKTLSGKKEIIKGYVKGIVSDEGIGMNVSKLENTIDKYINPRKFYNSDVDFGLVTVNLSNLKPITLTKKEIPEEKLKDYLMASATCFPAFKVKNIDNEKYIDGGYYDNLPINLAVDMGADNIIAVDLGSIGLKKRLKNKDVKVTNIVPKNNLGSFLVFDSYYSKRAIRFGYNDTMKVFKRLEGDKFTFKKNQLDYLYYKYSKNISSTLSEIFNYQNQKKTLIDQLLSNSKYTKLILNEKEKDVKKDLLKIIENLGESFDIDPSRIYTIKFFNKKLLTKLKNMDELNYKSIEEKIKNKQIRTLLNTTYIIKYIFEKLEKCNNDDCKKELCMLALLLPKDFLGAIYLSTIS